MRKNIKELLVGLFMLILLVPALVACNNASKPETEFVSIYLNTNYEVGEEFKAGTMVVKKDGKEITVDVTKDMVTGFDTSKAGKVVVTISYEGITKEVTLTVLDASKEAIEIVSVKFKTDYKVNEEFSGGELKVLIDGKETIVTITKDMVTGFDTSKTGEFEVKISYKGLEKKVTIKVSEKNSSGDTGWLPWV